MARVIQPAEITATPAANPPNDPAASYLVDSAESTPSQIVNRSAETSVSKPKPDPRSAVAEPHPESYFVISAAEITAHLDKIAREAQISLSTKRGTRIHSGKITMFAEQFTQTDTLYHEIVYSVSAENEQVRITLERAVTDGQQMAQTTQAIVLQRLASEVEQLVAQRSATNTLDAVDYAEGELIFKLK